MISSHLSVPTSLRLRRSVKIMAKRPSKRRNDINSQIITGQPGDEGTHSGFPSFPAGSFPTLFTFRVGF